MKRAKGINVTTRDIAAKVGCSHATVSRALRGEPKVSEAMHKKINEAAEELGYKPNPLVSSLMAGRINSDSRKFLSANMAWINTHPNKEFWHTYAYNKHLIDSATKRANELGFGFDELWAYEQDLTGERFKEILKARSIHGLIFINDCRILNRINFDSSEFASVAIGEKNLGQYNWNRAGVSFRRNIEIAFDHLHSRGFKKIAFLCPTKDTVTSISDLGSVVTRHDSIVAETAGYLLRQQFIEEKSRLAPFFYNRAEDADYLEHAASWILSNQPEAIIVKDNSMLKATEIAGLNVPEEIGIAHLHLGEGEKGWAGITTHRAQQVEAAIDILSNSILFNRRGVPEVPTYLHIQGEWVQGWTVKED